ncbi:MAG: ankyrin repeat domain-containing protein [Clostridiales bacterium]|nr:ankyrin repeat domain-containing protein [Clostridiales bacterium]
MAKRKTLPKDFQEMSFEKSDEELKEVLGKCQIGAYTNSYSKETAFFFELSDGMYKWLLDRGEEIEQTNTFGDTPLMHLLGITRAEKNCLSLIELGANINYINPSVKNNMLHKACSSGHIEVVKLLVSRGVDMNA